MQFKRKSYFLIAASCLLTACMVGPDFRPPLAPPVSQYTQSPVPKKTVRAEGQRQYFIAGCDVPAAWWRLFHSVEINQLIDAGLAHSPNLEAALANWKQAQELLNAQIGSTLYPSVTGQLGAQRQRYSVQNIGGTGANIGGSPTVEFNLYNAGVNISYTLDVFGGLRRQVEAFAAQVDYNRYLYDAAYLTLTSNIVTTALGIASMDAQIDAMHDIIIALKEQLKIVEKQYKLGGTSGANVLQQVNQLAATEAILPQLEQTRAQLQHSLAVLIGEFPGNTQAIHINLDTLKLPQILPTSLPCAVVRHRPDVMAAEATLHAASAKIGVAVANLYPQFNLTGAYGWTNSTPGNLFAYPNNVWNFGGNLLQPIYNAGALQAQKRAAIDAYQAAAEQYRQTVLQAFQNVADTLRAIENDSRALKDQRTAEIAAKGSLVITEKQYKVGGVSYISLLTVQNQYQQARINRIKAQAARLSDTAALFQALGGDWWR
ncbi:RND transporter [Gammaproteobacteria bacterium SCGC AG-212-F23]|nr:RND transporter [Gammaproteobacteria bacterium SCGC AG-212-F23]